MLFRPVNLILLIFCSALWCGACSKDPTQPPPDPSAAGSLAPPDGECLFILGQADETQMRAYLNEVRNEPLPAGFAFYTSLSNGAVQGDLPRYKSFCDDYPNTTLQLAIWTGERQWGDPGYYLDEILSGRYDANISALASACRTFGKPIYIRFGYEFDGWHNAYPPDKYIAAYRYFVDRMRQAGVKNVAYVWHSWGVGAYYGSSDFPAFYPPLPQGQEVNQALWYPGDDYVDWVGLSVFGSGWGDLQGNQVIQWLISFAENHGKPVMLAESAPIKTSGQSDPDWVIPNTDWLRNVYSLCAANDAVKAFTYINVDWEGSNPSSTWGDTRIQAAPSAVRNFWLQQVSGLRHGGAALYEAIGYQP
ncbi:MAG: hypothetical protein KDI06_20435 [Calditrichaeota bacterium]|nr:hypothetical protein [Calditrichota bacterium]HQU73417.1 hypothetical protein [Calditrichia bacterium]